MVEEWLSFAASVIMWGRKVSISEKQKLMEAAMAGLKMRPGAKAATMKPKEPARSAFRTRTRVAAYAGCR